MIGFLAIGYGRVTARGPTSVFQNVCSANTSDTLTTSLSVRSISAEKYAFAPPTPFARITLDMRRYPSGSSCRRILQTRLRFRSNTIRSPVSSICGTPKSMSNGTCTLMISFFVSPGRMFGMCIDLMFRLGCLGTG